MQRVRPERGGFTGPSEDGAVRWMFRECAGDYAHRPHDGRIVLLRLSERDAMSVSPFDPALGGDHIGTLTEPDVAVIANALRPHLSRTGAVSS